MILLYHKIAKLQHDYNDLGVTPENFRYQLEYIKKHYEIVPLEQVKDDTAAITFDDGFKDFYTEAYPYLSENNIPASLFITTGKIDSKEELWTSELLRIIFIGNDHSSYCHLEMPAFSYDFPVRRLEDKIIMYRAIRRLCMKSEEAVLQSIILQLRKWAGVDSVGREEYLFLTECEIQALSKDSLVTIGAHTHNHISLGAFSKEYQEKEIIHSKAELERIIGKEVQYFSYPFGQRYDYNEETIEILKHSGIKNAYTTLLQSGKDAEYEVPRIAVPNLGKGEFEPWFHKVVQKQDECIEAYPPKDRRIEYIGRLKDDERLLRTDGKIAIFGAGVRGQRLYQELKVYGKGEAVICFIDNDKTKQGSSIEGRQIVSVEQSKDRKPDIILVSSIWEKEIIEQLVQCGIESIHWIVN